ncbi:eukaryotic peptide chain release factor subunit 1 [Yasminevirus sp. GU-2018]|uniref:Eukaryotic peptide chain release factor subunit 1 n=1 Tax=Yasminevirus sp. GU-2018 TaxID=2420051 RepID=A0A5K0U978_9VIRU|nr:eukaryotic peptide chain release factor subunit 1 [Yasminevirus sp. GU-2018]
MEVRNSFYRCDSKFHLDTVIDMYADHRVDGIVYTNGETCVWYSYKNWSLKKLASQEIHLQNQFKNGGQSSNRLARNRDIQREHYVTRLAEKTVELFYDKNVNYQTVTHLVLCGPAEFKTELSEHKLITNFFENTHVVTMGGLMDQTVLANAVSTFDDPSEKAVLDRIQKMVQSADSKLVFGDEIVAHLKSRELKTLYVHVDVDLKNFMKSDISNMFDYNIEVVHVTSHSIIAYGGAVGEKFY